MPTFDGVRLMPEFRRAALYEELPRRTAAFADFTFRLFPIAATEALAKN